MRLFPVCAMLNVSIGLAFASNEFLGAAECGKCHPAQFEKQRRSRHAAALKPIAESILPDRLIGHTVREKNGLQFEYAPASNGISVTAMRDGKQSSAKLEWAFGAGAKGITAVGKSNATYLEHRVSWYPQQGSAGLTVGHEAAAPPTISAALGQAQSPDVIYRCFNCHATGVKPGPDLSAMRPGIECERCHGPGAQHGKQPSAQSISNPGRLSAQALVRSCGQCHRLPSTSAAELNNPETVRFAPIGLMASRCFQASGKLSCLTCHDPHDDAHQDAEFYTAKCLDCHAASVTSGAQCRRASRENCLPCHMQRTSPTPFLQFTDHRIRIVTTAQSPDPVSWAPVEKALDTGDLGRARQLLDSLPSSSAKWHLLASRIYDGRHDPARAVSEAEAAIAIDPRNLPAYLQLGQIFLAHNTPAPALEIFSEALQIAPDSLLARLGKGLALKDLQRLEEAEKELAACLSQNPRLGIAFDALAGMYLQSDSEKLTAVSRNYIETNPSDYRGYYYLAAAKDREKAPAAETEALIRRSLQLAPNFSASYALLGKVLLREDRPQDAAQALERAVQLRPDYPPAHFYLGNAYRKLGREADASREFETVRELNEKRSSQPALLYHRGTKDEVK